MSDETKGSGMMCPKCAEAYMYCACPDNPLNSKVAAPDADLIAEVERLKGVVKQVDELWHAAVGEAVAYKKRAEIAEYLLEREQAWSKTVVAANEGIAVACKAAEAEVANLKRQRDELIELLSIEAEDRESDLAGMSCDSGNPDGGGIYPCDHCELKARIVLLRRAIETVETGA